MTKHHGWITALACALAGLMVAGCATNNERQKVLKLSHLMQFIDTTLLQKFEEAYAEQSGIKDFHVEWTPYFADEDVIDDLRKNQSDYDLIGLLDYRVAQLAQENLLRALDHAKLPSFEVYDPMLVDLFLDPGNVYSVPYSYGTLGILYNPTNPGVSREDFDTWSVFWNPKYKGKVMMVGGHSREAFTIGMFHSFAEQLQTLSAGWTYPRTYSSQLSKFTTDISSEQSKQVTEELVRQVSTVGGAGAYADMDSERKMIAGERDAAMTWSCRANLCMKQNPALEYVIPREGTLIHVVHWTIPKQSQNVAAAYAFISFFNRKDIAERNIAYICTPSSVKAAIDAYRATLDRSDYPFFTGKQPEWIAQYKDNFIPSSSTLRRCCLSSYTNVQLDYMQNAMSTVMKAVEEVAP
jgi:spermidine/putrescine transport system substrate-binding protein